MPLATDLAEILSPAYRCPEFDGACKCMKWKPEEGHVPRGFHGAYGSPCEVELVLVCAEPGNPHSGERHTGIESAFEYTGSALEAGTDRFHENVLKILELCWPGQSFEQKMRRTWLTDSVLCSAEIEGGPVPKSATLACGNRYLKRQLALFPNALVVALGVKAQKRLRGQGVEGFLCAAAVAPPGCYFSGARASWEAIPQALKSRQTAETQKVHFPSEPHR